MALVRNRPFLFSSMALAAMLLAAPAHAQSEPTLRPRTGLGIGIATSSLSESQLERDLEGRGTDFSLSWTFPRYVSIVARTSRINGAALDESETTHFDLMTHLRPFQVQLVDPFIEVGITRRSIRREDSSGPPGLIITEENQVLAFGAGLRIAFKPSLSGELDAVVNSGGAYSGSGADDLRTFRWRAGIVWSPRLRAR